MNSLELALEQFFQQYRFNSGHFDFVEEGDIFIAEEVLEYFFQQNRFTSQDVQDFLNDFSKLPRIQAIMIFKMKQQSMLAEIETQYRKFKAKKLENLHRVHRKDAISEETSKSVSKSSRQRVAK